MANNYGSFEGTMDANGILGGEIQFNGAGGKVKDVQVNDVSVVDANGVAKIDLTPYAEIENVYDKQTIDTALEGKADTDDIPTELSDLTDDENHRLVTDTEKSTWDNKADVSDIPTVNNPTITIQKNGQNVDTFSLNQTTDKVIDISVPTKTSDLQNDSSFITNTVNNLANYYLKSQTYTQAEVDALIDAAVNGRFRKVTVLPATGEPNIIYLVPKATPETSNACDEYIWQDNAWELIGSTDIDLSGYVTDEDLGIALADYLTISAFNTAIANYYTKTEVGNLLDGKVDKVSGKGLSTNDYDNTAKGIVDGVTNALAGKVDKVNGKGLSTEDYTTTEKNKLAGISTNANKVEASTTNGNIKIDGTETQVYDDSEIQDKIDETTTSISGNPISISGLKSNQLAVNPIITLEPIQAGSGTPSPSNIRAISGYDKIEVLSCGRNLIEGKLTGYTITSSGGNVYANAGNDLQYAKVVKGATYTISEQSQYVYGFFTEEPTTTSTSYNGERVVESNYSFTAPISGYVAVRTVTGASAQIEAGSTQHTIEPYHKTTDISESLGQTVYGLTHEVRTGKAKKTRIMIDMGDIVWDYNSASNRLWFIAPTISEAKLFPETEVSSIICEAYYTDKVNTIANDTSVDCAIGISQNGRIVVRNLAYDNANDFKTAMTGIKIVYELKESAYTEIQLTPHEISLLSNYAYVSTNGTSISLDYHNGELASLADVSQLGETVALLDRPQERKIQVNITSYNSQSNRYSCPFDGYVTASLPSGTGYVRVTVYDHNEQTMGIFHSYATSDGDTYFTVPVRKGMKAMVSNSSDISPTVTYRGMA